MFGLDLQELQTYRERVNSITPDDIQRVAQQYLHPDRLSIVLVGDAKVFAGQLPAVGFEKVERIPLNQLDLAAVDLRARRAAPGGREEAAPMLVTASYAPSSRDDSARQPEGAQRLVDKAIAANRRLLLRAMAAVEEGRPPPLCLGEEEAARLTGPATIDGMAPTEGWEAHWRAAVARRRAQAPWAPPALTLAAE